MLEYRLLHTLLDKLSICVSNDSNSAPWDILRFSNIQENMFVFYFHGTNYHYFGDFKQHTIYCISLNGSEVWAWLSWVLCLRSHKAAVEMLPRAVVSSDTWGTFPNSYGCWQSCFLTATEVIVSWLVKASSTITIWEGPSLSVKASILLS